MKETVFNVVVLNVYLDNILKKLLEKMFVKIVQVKMIVQFQKVKEVKIVNVYSAYMVWNLIMIKSVKSVILQNVNNL